MILIDDDPIIRSIERKGYPPWFRRDDDVDDDDEDGEEDGADEWCE